MMSLTMMCLTRGPLLRVFFLFALMNPLVVFTTLMVVLTIPLVMFVVWVLVILFQW